LFLFSAFAQAETIFYFPHYGDGDGLSMVFTFENPSNMNARVNVEVSDTNGNMTQLNYLEYGLLGDYYFDLEPKGSLTLKTLGSSIPLKTGFIRVQSDNDNVTGVAIFQYAWGGETSILPVKAKKRFVLPFEKNSNLDLGLAFCREQRIPVEINLYNTSGGLVDYAFYDSPGYQYAAFSDEIFGLVPISEGTIILESEGFFAPMGLRFGNGVLSSLPSDEAKETSHYWAYKLSEPSGFWFFDYTIGSVTTNTYAMYQIADIESSSFKYVAIGIDEWGDFVMGGWTQSFNEIYFLDTSILFDYAYTFSFVSDDEVEGCMYMRDQDTGNLGTCWPLYGARFIYDPASAEITPSLSLDSTIREKKEGDLIRSFKPEITSGHLKETFDILANQAYEK